MRFFFHYNKPASQRAGTAIMSVHAAKQCHLVTHIDCQVPCQTRFKTTQPRAVMAGTCTEILVEDGKAIIR